MMPRGAHGFFFRVAMALTLALMIAGCTKGGQFDPTELFNSDMFDTKKKLKGERVPVFPEGVPGATTGVPPDLVKGYQAPPEPADADAAVPGPTPPAAAAETETQTEIGRAEAACFPGGIGAGPDADHGWASAAASSDGAAAERVANGLAGAAIDRRAAAGAIVPFDLAGTAGDIFTDGAAVTVGL